MARDDWWTGSRQAGLDRAVSMGGPLPPGSLPPAMANEYRMAPQDARADVVGGWNEQALAAARAHQAQGAQQEEQNWRSRLEEGLARAGAMRQQPKRKRRGASMNDAGDALASQSGVR